MAFEDGGPATPKLWRSSVIPTHAPISCSAASSGSSIARTPRSVSSFRNTAIRFSTSPLRPDGWAARPTGPRPAFSFVFGNPPQGRQPKIVTAVHQAFVGVTQLLGVVAFPDLVGDHHASVALRLQIPCVVESRLGTGRVAIPADAGVGHEFIDAAFEIDAERLPAEHRARVQLRGPAGDLHVLR